MAPEPPAGWTVWNEEPGGRLILVFRPDVFDTEAFDPACLPTLSVGPGASPDAPPERRAASGSWYVALYLEPEVRVRDSDAAHDDREAAVEGALEIAERFAAGAIDYRAAYRRPREAYLDRLDALTGRGD